MFFRKRIFLGIFFIKLPNFDHGSGIAFKHIGIGAKSDTERNGDLVVCRLRKHKVADIVGVAKVKGVGVVGHGAVE